MISKKCIFASLVKLTAHISIEDCNSTAEAVCLCYKHAEIYLDKLCFC